MLLPFFCLPREDDVEGDDLDSATGSDDITAEADEVEL